MSLPQREPGDNGPSERFGVEADIAESYVAVSVLAEGLAREVQPDVERSLYYFDDETGAELNLGVIYYKYDTADYAASITARLSREADDSEGARYITLGFTQDGGLAFMDQNNSGDFSPYIKIADDLLDSSKLDRHSEVIVAHIANALVRGGDFANFEGAVASPSSHPSVTHSLSDLIQEAISLRGPGVEYKTHRTEYLLDDGRCLEVEYNHPEIIGIPEAEMQEVSDYYGYVADRDEVMDGVDLHHDDEDYELYDEPLLGISIYGPKDDDPLEMVYRVECDGSRSFDVFSSEPLGEAANSVSLEVRHQAAIRFMLELLIDVSTDQEHLEKIMEL